MVTLKVRFLKSFFDKSIGLLGAKIPHTIYFKTKYGIHTFGMRFPIDVLILDNDYKIVKLTENLKPNKIFTWPTRFDNVLELPTGEIKRLKLKQGDEIKLEKI